MLTIVHCGCFNGSLVGYGAAGAATEYCDFPVVGAELCLFGIQPSGSNCAVDCVMGMRKGMEGQVPAPCPQADGYGGNL